MKIKIDVDGIGAVKKRLGRRAAADLVDAIELDIGNEARKQAVEAAKESPVDTGALRASILSSPQREGEMTFFWGSRLPYALRQEYEHAVKKGWQRKAFRQGNKIVLKTLKGTIKRKLEG